MMGHTIHLPTLFTIISCTFMKFTVWREQEKKGIGFTLPVNPMLRGILSVACSIRRMCSGDGVQVVAQVPEAGPVPPPTKVVTPVPPRGSKFID